MCMLLWNPLLYHLLCLSILQLCVHVVLVNNKGNLQSFYWLHYSNRNVCWPPLPNWRLAWDHGHNAHPLHQYLGGNGKGRKKRRSRRGRKGGGRGKRLEEEEWKREEKRWGTREDTNIREGVLTIGGGGGLIVEAVISLPLQLFLLL